MTYVLEDGYREAGSSWSTDAKVGETGQGLVQIRVPQFGLLSLKLPSSRI